jgi:hypothetical protein
MVTGAVFATRRSVLASVAGFDERFNLEYNDMDLCLRLRLLGYRIVYTPFAEFIHYEKSSRGEALPDGGEVALFLKRWKELLNNDPAFHPQFERYNLNITPSYRPNPWYDAVRLDAGLTTPTATNLAEPDSRPPAVLTSVAAKVRRHLEKLRRSYVKRRNRWTARRTLP